MRHDSKRVGAQLLLSALYAGTCISAAAVSPSTLQSSVTLLFQNNLNWTDDVNHAGFLLLDPMTFKDAQAACKSLNETLVTHDMLNQHSSDIIPRLQYLNHRNAFTSNQKFWTADGTTSLSGQTLSNTKRAPSPFRRRSSSALTSRLPVLCTQSSRGTTDGDSLATSSNLISTSQSLHPLKNTFTGFRNLKSFRFEGIPYSNTVVRFKHSTLNSAKATAFDATKFGPECVQTGGGTMSEQCLFLNIFTPFLPSSNVKDSQLKPVFFLIHGGAFTGGTGADGTFDGGNTASRSDIVVVTINYRLSSVGFLALPNSTLTGNYGFGDQVTALDWVHANIRVFGGDPNRITIWGQSAGAASVRALMASPKSIGKFSASILDSNLGGFDFATIFSQYPTIPEEAELAANAVVQLTNCTNSDVEAVIACLTKVPATTLVNLPVVSRYVVVDHIFILSNGLQVTGKGPVARVPSIWSLMAGDGGPFIGFPTPGESLKSAIQAIIPENITDAAIASGLFPVPNTGNATLDIFNVTQRIATDVEFRCLDQASVFSAIKHNVLEDVWFAQFDKSYQTPGFDPNFPTCDAPKTTAFPNGDPDLPYFQCHSGDLFYEFATLGQTHLPFRNAEDLIMTQLIMDYWASFVWTHNPNPDEALLEAIGSLNTLKLVRQTGQWEKVTKSKNTLRRMDVPPRTDGFQEIAQCKVLTLPLTFYETSL